MAEEGYYLTERDVRRLRGVLDWLDANGGSLGWTHRRRVLPAAASSYGAAYGSTTSIAATDTKVTLGTLATDTSSGITLDDGGLLFAGAGVFMASGTVALAASYSGVADPSAATVSIYRKRGADPAVKIVEMDSHWQAVGSGDRGYQGVITDYPIAIEAGDHLYLYASAGTDYTTAACISAILGVHT